MSPKKVLLSDNTTVVQRFKRAVEDCTLPHVPQMIREILETGAWRERYELGKIIRFDDFTEFVTGKKPAGCGWDPEIVTTLLLKAEDTEALKLWQKAIRAKVANEIEEKDRANESQQGKRTDLVDNKIAVINEVERPTGTSAAAALRRLRKDRPEIHARVLAGELSPHAGMIEAGFRKKPVRKKVSAFDRAAKQAAKLSDIEWQTLKREEDARRLQTKAEAAE